MRISELCRLDRIFPGTEGTEIIEFAVSLPLLVILIVGIYDFGSAFTVKNKLNSAVRAGVRLASGQVHPPNPSADDGNCGVPASICLVRDVIAKNLQASMGDDCGLIGASGTSAAAPAVYTWTFSGGCSGLSLKVERGIVNPNTAVLPSPFSSSPYRVENTTITLIYPYQWQFNQAFKLLDRNANYLSSTITVSATMQNVD